MEAESAASLCGKATRTYLTSSDGSIGAEGNECADDELQSGQQQLMVSLGRWWQESVKLCDGRGQLRSLSRRSDDSPMAEGSSNGRAPRYSHSARRVSSSALINFSAPSRVDASRMRNDICAS